MLLRSAAAGATRLLLQLQRRSPLSTVTVCKPLDQLRRGERDWNSSTLNRRARQLDEFCLPRHWLTSAQVQPGGILCCGRFRFSVNVT